RLHLGGRDVGTPPVERYVAVQHELARLFARVSEPEAVHDVVEPRLEDPQEVFTSHAWQAFGCKKVLVELALQNPVNIAGFLLLLELQAEFAFLAPAAIAWRGARRRGPSLDRALRRET